MKRSAAFIYLFFFIIPSLKTVAQQITWNEILPGVWKAVAGKPENYDLLKAAGSLPNKEAIAKLAKAAFPFSKADIDIKITDGKTYLRFPLDHQEQLYGFGLNFQTVNQRGSILELHVDHYGGHDNGRTHSPTPFYVSSKGYGVFINSARYLKVYAGTAVRKESKNKPEEQDRNTDTTWNAQPYSDAVEILVPAGGVEIFVFGGPTSMDAVRRFNLYNGGGCLPPRWGLGFTQRMKSLFTSDEIANEAADFEKNGYPLDFIGLEPGWQSKSYPGSFEWDHSRYPTPEKFINEMLQKNIRLNLWINPYVSKYAPFYKDILPYTGSHMVWNGLVPDFTLPQARNYFFGQLKKSQIQPGVSGYKIDEVDGYDNWLWPDVATFPGGKSAEQMRQTYGVLAQRYSTDVFHSLNKRTYGLVRGSNAGAVSFPYVIYNDYYKHEDFVTALINSGFAGVLWTPEVRASATSEEWLRRMQTVIFSPMAMINAWASGTKPWTYPDVAAQVKELALLRMRMMPYWYSEFAKYHFEGTPPFRAINLEEGFYENNVKEKANANLEENPYLMATTKEIKDQYMAGEYLLVAPLFTGEKTRQVILPKGNWYDFYTGAYAGNGEIITVSPGLDKIPVYVKDGAIISMQPARLHAPKANEKVDIEFRHYGEKEGVYKLYDDDGETFNYEKGIYSWRTVTMKKNESGKWNGTISAPVKGKPNTIGNITWTQVGNN
ncbi:MAG: glycoside hydrolase family 31 protein [Chitinophagaceae bacterium]